MRPFIPLLALLFVLVSASPEATAQTPGACTIGTAQGDLDVSNVFARVFNTGSLFFGNSTTSGNGYTTPRLSGTGPLFAAGLWLGGKVNGDVRVAGARYTNYTFWPGPLNADGTLPDADDCSAFDRIYVVSVADIDRYEASGETTADLAEWPVGLGAPAVDASGQPLAVTSREQTLNLATGERPVLYGSQTAWWIMNDVGGPHTALDTEPLGVEVRVSAFAIAGAGDTVPGTPESTFYRYQIVNRSANDITDMHASFFLDPDLGNASDDYIGTDSTRGLFLVYNSSPTDASYGIPPALGFDILSGAGASSYFESVAAGPTSDPSMGEAFYYFMQGLWGDGTEMRANLNGYGQPASFPVTTYAYPGDPVAEQTWSEVNFDGAGTDNASGDRRGVVSTPAFDLASGESRTVDLGILFAQGTDRFDSITELRAVSDAVQAAYDDGSLFSLGSEIATLPAPTLIAPEAGQYVGAPDSVRFSWDAVPGADGYILEWGPTATSMLNSRAFSATRSTIRTTDLVSGSGSQTFYWSVRAIADAAIGTSSEPRAVSVFIGGPLVLASGAPAYVEVANGDGTDPCAAEARSTDGCDEVGGNNVYHSFNSTGAYYFSESGTGSEPLLGQYAPNDFEIRFTDEGSIMGYAFQTPYNVIRVPFEIWDIGSTPPGEANDPSDDVRLIPYGFADNSGTCAFNADEKVDGTTFSDFVESDRIYASYPATSYADFEAAFAGLVDAAPDGCHASGSQEAILDFTTGTRVIQRQVFGSPATAPALPATGTIIRMYTTGAAPVSTAEAPSASGDLSLRIGPNPTRGAATVRLTLTSPEAVRVRVLDALGREVAILSEGPQASGEHVWAMPAGLASGVYAVEARAGDRRMTRLVTVVR